MRLAPGAWTTLGRAAYLACLGLALTAALEPVVKRRAAGIEYLIVFDASLSMATEDYAEGGFPRSRLDLARDVFRQALPDLPPQARLTVAGFAGGTVQVFLLSHPARDLGAIEAALSVLEWDNVWDVGSRIDQGLRDIVVQAQRSSVFSVAGRQRILPAPLNIFFFTDGGGADARPQVLGDATAWLLDNARVTFVGVGQTRSSTVPEFRRAPLRDCLRDESGECITSRLNEGNLRSLADWLEGRYEPLGDAEQLRRLMLEEPLTGAESDVARGIGWLFGLGALALFLVGSLA
ncbi:MAG: hypothetical protein ACE5JR_03930 [Gemmatimonadota bacterium]